MKAAQLTQIHPSYGMPVKAAADKNTETVWLINWDEPEQNYFAITKEVTLKGNQQHSTAQTRSGVVYQRYRFGDTGAQTKQCFHCLWYRTKLI